MFKLAKLAAALFFAAAVFVYFFGRGIMDKALESAVGTKVSISHIGFSLSPPAIELKSIRVHNLPGFRQPIMAEIPLIYVSINPLGFLTGKTHVTSLRLHIDRILVERSSRGQINLNELRKILDEKQVAARRGSPAPQRASLSARPEQGTAPKGPQLVIDRAEFSLGDVTYVDTGKTPEYKKDYRLNIRRQVLEDVTDPMRVTEQIIGAVLKNISFNMIGAELDKVASGLGKSLSDLFD